MSRCSWVGSDPLMVKYHDTEWGVPVHDDGKLFEFMVLDSMQAGLSWRIILHKREGMRKAFAGFDPGKVARFSSADVARLLEDPGIIRNRQKVNACISNAQQFLAVQKEFGSFATYIWQFVGGETQVNQYRTDEQIPDTSPESDAMSADLRRRGFKFVGSTICYAFMQGAGLVNDHITSCFRYPELTGARQGL